MESRTVGAANARAGEDAGGYSDTLGLYSALAADYDESFARVAHRRAYDRLAGELIDLRLPPTGADILDVGCGAGRWASRWLARGHRVTGIEASPGMIDALAARELGSEFTLIEGAMEEAHVAASSMDLVAAMGSVQYAHDPGEMIGRFANWVRPNGFVCVYVDSLVALVLELIRLGRHGEALERLATREGVFKVDDKRAGLRLYDRAALVADFERAGLVEIECRGLLVSNSALGAEGFAKALAQDEEALLAFERRLAGDPLVADAGRHLFAVGRRPS